MSLENMTPAPGSFRDPSGAVYLAEKAVFRRVNEVYKDDWTHVVESGFSEHVVEKGLLLPFEEVEPLPDHWKTLKSPRLDVITYPYEWCFSQVKDAALLTLSLLEESLRYGLVLKDATAFNVQFKGVTPLFIDHLSFAIRDINKPWVAYLQFCKHFLAPLALLHYKGGQFGKLSTLWIDGLPLDIVSSLLPCKSHFSFSLQLHLHAHARLQSKHSDARKSASDVKKMRLKPDALEKLCLSLQYAVEGLHLPQQKTEWGDYYSDTNYSSRAAKNKANVVDSIAREHSGTLALDIGANTGEYSQILSTYFTSVVAADIDHLAVERHYRHLVKSSKKGITPVVFDMTNPSPGIGFLNKERISFFERFSADFVTALALIHHLTLGSGIPLAQVAASFDLLVKKGGTLLLEFVPLEDSQVQRMMAGRENVFTDYSLEGCIEAFSSFFTLEKTFTVEESSRTLLVFHH